VLIVLGGLGGIGAIAVGAAVVSSRKRRNTVPVRVPRAIDVSPITSHDPEFSRSVFEDFAFDLYAAAHRSRGAPSDPYAPYLTRDAANKLAARGPAPQQVVIGTLALDAVSYRSSPQPQDRVVVHIEATHLGSESTYVIERWTFSRLTTAQSHPPTRTRTWPCPSCGSPWQAGAERTCAHCGQNVEGGRFDWVVEAIEVVSETTALASLRGTVAEQGNTLPTVVDPHASVMLQSITQADPHVTFASLEPRIQLIYRQLNLAWNASDLGPVRGFVTASLRNYLDYWLREYKRQGLSNQLTDATLHKIELAKVTRDRFYDAITVRIFADGTDFTRDDKGTVVGGSTTARRTYTEYWTFLRSASRRGAITTAVACPNCGAAVAMSDLGDCTYCNTPIENGSIDWTLSRIEQDDSYAG
jgi:hypothetical protein